MTADAIREAVAKERERCIDAAKQVCQALRGSALDYAHRKDHGEALRSLVQCDGVLLAMTAIAKEAPAHE